MLYIYSILIIAVSSLLWRIRGGLWKEYIPANKIWYALAFGAYACIYFGSMWENFIVGFIACYSSYQLYGWGVYIGRLLTGYELNPDTDRECELIDDLLYPLHVTINGNKYYLYQYPKLFGFLGTTLTGLIITFLWGLYLGNLVIMVSGLGMGAVYWIGGQIEKIYPLGKSGWNWGEWIFGAYLGGWLVWVML